MSPSTAKSGMVPVAVSCPSAAPLQVAVLKIAVIHTQLSFVMILSLNLGNSSMAAKSSCSEGKGHPSFSL